MKRRILTHLILAATLAFTGCAKKDAPLTETQQAAIRDEVLQAVKPMLAAFEKVDIDAALKLAQDGPAFELVMPDGKAIAFAEFKKGGGEFFAALSSQKLVPRKEKVLVLAPDAALYLWQGRYDMTQKDGAVLRSDPYALTYLYRKVEGKWMFICGHESGLPHQPVKAEEPAVKSK